MGDRTRKRDEMRSSARGRMRKRIDERGVRAKAFFYLSLSPHPFPSHCPVQNPRFRARGKPHMADHSDVVTRRPSSSAG